MKSLEEARTEIDHIDQEMARLFEQRMKTVEDVVKYKLKHSLPILDVSREQAVLDKNSRYIQDQSYLNAYLSFQKHLMDLSKNHQSQFIQSDVIAYQGIEGAFSHIALQHLFKDQKSVSYQSFEQVCLAVLNGDVSKAVLPFENSYTGEVGEVIDLLYRYEELMITEVYDLKIDQHLLSLPTAKLSDIKQVYSHEQALNQCKDFLDAHAFEVHAYANTAMAAKYVSEKQDLSCAAIASIETAQRYGLHPLVQNIHTRFDNSTRFIVISKHSKPQGNRMSFFFTVDHQAGSLAKVINAISKHGFNMDNIKSRSIHQHAWRYYFYVEIEGSFEDSKTHSLLKDFDRYCQSYRYLGTYLKQEH